jgi:FKBP-type peptidyl-prolyl cis-trans isomerase
MMTRWVMAIVVLLAAPALAAGNQDQEASADEGKSSREAEGLMPHVTLETTLGDIELELNGVKAPISTHNFMTYVEAGYYDGTIFHRVMPSFMIQGGGFLPDMNEKRMGLRPPIVNEWQNGLKNTRGTIAMARTNAPDSARAQFFINVVDNTSLDRASPRTGGAGYAVFGRVVSGMDVVDKIRNTETTKSPKLRMGKVVPKEPVIIKAAKVSGKYDRKKLAAAVKKIEDEKKAAEARRKAEQEKELQDFIQKTEQETGKTFESSASGLRWIVLQEGDGPTPGPTDQVMAHYTGWLLDGSKFDSSVDRGTPFQVNMRGGVIKGWLEGLAMMKAGEKRKFLIPPDLAYGPRGYPPVIPPNAHLVFDIELLQIKQ